MEYTNQNELYHYGVLGMKWGQHRAKSLLRKASTSSDKNYHAKAVKTIGNHEHKIQKKLASLEKTEKRLTKKDNKYRSSLDLKAAKMNRKAVRLKKKSTGKFVSDKKAFKLIRKANKLEAKASSIMTKSAKIKQKLYKNEKMQKAFSQGLKDINELKVQAGKQYIGYK